MACCQACERTEKAVWQKKLFKFIKNYCKNQCVYGIIDLRGKKTKNPAIQKKVGCL